MELISALDYCLYETSQGNTTADISFDSLHLETLSPIKWESWDTAQNLIFIVLMWMRERQAASLRTSVCCCGFMIIMFYVIGTVVSSSFSGGSA